MNTLNHKVDFAAVVWVKNANPNGDPLNGNRPREDYDGFGEISDVCIKRKIRNRLQDMGQSIFVQSDDRADDGCKSLRERADAFAELKKAESNKDKELYIKLACERWIDVRSFGQLFAFKNAKAGEGVSVSVRGPVSIHTAVSVAPIQISSMQITKSVNSETGEKKTSDTMGTKHRVDYGMYVFYGSINPQLASKTGFTDEDAKLIHEALKTLFENDASSARPDGSMVVRKLYWWEHNCASGQYPSAKVHHSVQVALKEGCNPKLVDSYQISCTPLEGLACEEYDGI